MVYQSGTVTDGKNRATYSIERNTLNNKVMLFIGSHAWHGTKREMESLFMELIREHKLAIVNGGVS